MNSIPLPHVFTAKEDSTNSALFVIEPFYPGFGTTVGNAIRRVLLSSLEGAAISAVHIKGVTHEFSTFPGVKEDFVDIILNLKKIVVRVEDFVDPEGMKLSLSAHGERVVIAGDFKTSSGVEIVNSDFPVMTLTGSGSSIELEARLSRGRGFIPVESREKEERELGLIAIDSYFSPIVKVGFSVEDVRVGQDTNYDRVKMSVETNGVLSPREAVERALQILLQQFEWVLGMVQGKDDIATEETADVLVRGHDVVETVSELESLETNKSHEIEKPKAKRSKKKKEE